MFYAIIIIHQIRVEREFWDKSFDFWDNLIIFHQIIPENARFIPEFDFNDIL